MATLDSFNFHELEMVTDQFNKLLLDGKELKGITNFKINFEPNTYGNGPTITLEMKVKSFNTVSKDMIDKVLLEDEDA